MTIGDGPDRLPGSSEPRRPGPFACAARFRAASAFTLPLLGALLFWADIRAPQQIGLAQMGWRDALAIGGLLAYLRRASFAAFAAYRVLLAALILLVLVVRG